ANESFGISLPMLQEARERVEQHHTSRGLKVSNQQSASSPQPLNSITNHRSPAPVKGQEPKAHCQSPIANCPHNVMYFETGQGSALSAEAHHGVDQLTLEARAYGLARVFEPFLVNSVVGFIGPEYLYDERQIIRAGLEDHFMGKLLGLPMG